MKLHDITTRLNKLLGDERHPYSQLVIHLDKAIDEINSQLNSTFPAFSELAPGKAEYDYFPDQYIRSVVLPGAASFYFTTDEEGIMTAPQYAMDFQRGIFVMLRDYFNQVPEEYQSNTTKAIRIEGDFENRTVEGRYIINGIDLIP